MSGKGAWANGSPPGWRELREFVLQRDHFRCKIKLPKCTGVADQTHHTLGVNITGILCDPQYLIAACRSCNRNVGEVDSRALISRQMTLW